MRKRVWTRRRQRVSQIIEVGSNQDIISRVYDIFSSLILVVNLAVLVLYTYENVNAQYHQLFYVLETITVIFFAVDYILRIWTAPCRYPGMPQMQAVRKYALSLTGLIDLLSFLPYFLPMVFPTGAAVFRLFRVVRVFRLFRINAYHDALSVIGEVLSNKRQQLISSAFIILVLMLASSLCMYSLEHEAQPEVFKDAFSGIWWTVSAIFTIGYGDVYPITLWGKIMSIFITFLGVGMIAIPTGIISAGFVDQYSRMKRIGEYSREEDIHFIKLVLKSKDDWVGKSIMELRLPHGVIVAMVRRGRDNIVPRGNVVLKSGDTIILGAEALKDDKHIELKEIVLLKSNPWNGQYIRELDISRQTMIVMVKRNGTMLVPKGSLMLLEGDHVILYSQEKIPHVSEIQEIQF